MSAPVFRTDVNIRPTNSQALLDKPSNSRGPSSKEYLDNAAESANKQIDTDIKAMLDGFEALVGLSRIRNKDKFRIAQESFELEARADVMVRAAQSLTLLSHSLKLSLLLIQDPTGAEEGTTSLDEEAIELIKSTAREKERCAHLLEEIFGMTGEDRKATETESKEAEPDELKARTATEPEANATGATELQSAEDDQEMSLL